MKIVITAGGTTEQIDTVRSITNTSTGMLGSLIAEEFSSYQEVDRIYYICSKKSILPKTPKAAIHFVDTVASLESCVSNIVNNEKIDIIVQSMAVSDYRVKWVTSACQLAENINSTPNPLASFQATKDTKVTESQVTSWISNSNTVITGSGKINSGIHDMVLLMEPTPKIISIYKKLTPDSILVGFKLLDHVDHDTLIDTGYHILQENKCSFVLANDLQDIEDGKHIGYLIDHNKQYRKFLTKQEIAEAIATATIKKWRDFT